MKLGICVLLLALVALSCAYQRTEDYSGQKVYTCATSNKIEVDFIYNAVHAFGLDVWTHRANGEIDIRVTPEQEKIDAVVARLERCKLIIPDVEEHVRSFEKEWLNKRATKQPAAWFDEYHTYTEIVAWYRTLAGQYPTLATFNPSIGKSAQGRDQPAFRFTGTRGTNKPTIYVQCQIHAREWISGATCQYVVNELLQNYGSVANVTELLDSAVFAFVPFVNPDGYEYTWTNDRLWRKNRETVSGSICVGVDLNRNYNSHWGEGGSSTNPCSDTYMGPSVGSSAETKNTVSYFRSLAPVIGAIDMHSYSQLILRPWGYTRTNSPHETFLKSVGDGMRDTILSSGGVAYTSQKSIDLYVTTGTASDWFYDTDATNTNAGYRAAGFTIELRDTGRYGFQLPPSQIIPTGNEIYHTFIYFAQRVIASPISA